MTNKGSIPYRERRTEGALGKINFLTSESIASSDLNESQTLILSNLVKFLYPTINRVEFIPSVVIDKTQSDASQIVIDRVRYVVYRPANKSYYVGGISHPVTISGLDITDEEQDIFIHYRFKDIRHSDKVYRDGVRSNNISIVSEEEVPNNIFDDILDTEVSTRSAIEFTFTVGDGAELSTYDKSYKLGSVVVDPSGDGLEFDLIDPIEVTGKGILSGDDIAGDDSLGGGFVDAESLVVDSWGDSMYRVIKYGDGTYEAGYESFLVNSYELSEGDLIDFNYNKFTDEIVDVSKVILHSLEDTDMTSSKGVLVDSLKVLGVDGKVIKESSQLNSQPTKIVRVTKIDKTSATIKYMAPSELIQLSINEVMDSLDKIAVTSVNGKVGDVHLTTSDIKSSRDYATSIEERLAYDAKFIREESDLDKENPHIIILGDHLDTLPSKGYLKLDMQSDLDSEVNLESLKIYLTDSDPEGYPANVEGFDGEVITTDKEFDRLGTDLFKYTVTEDKTFDVTPVELDDTLDAQLGGMIDYLNQFDVDAYVVDTRVSRYRSWKFLNIYVKSLTGEPVTSESKIYWDMEKSGLEPNHVIMLGPLPQYPQQAPPAGYFSQVLDVTGDGEITRVGRLSNFVFKGYLSNTLDGKESVKVDHPMSTTELRKYGKSVIQSVEDKFNDFYVEPAEYYVSKPRPTSIQDTIDTLMDDKASRALVREMIRDMKVWDVEYIRDGGPLDNKANPDEITIPGYYSYEYGGRNQRSKYSIRVVELYETITDSLGYEKPDKSVLLQVRFYIGDRKVDWVTEGPLELRPTDEFNPEYRFGICEDLTTGEYSWGEWNSLEGDVSRTSTIVIANYDSHENSKKGADIVIEEGENAAVKINEAIQSLKGTGGEVKLMEGEYNLEHGIAVNIPNVHLTGIYGATILKQSANWKDNPYTTSSTMKDIIDSSDLRETDMAHISNLILNGSNIANSTGFYCTSNIQVSGCTVNNSGRYGFRCYGNSQITNCTSNDSGTDGFVCRDNSQITNCTSNDSSEYGFKCLDNSQISNCTSNDSGRYGFVCRSDSQITNCTSNNSGSDGFDCVGNSQITNCTSNNSSGCGFKCLNNSQITNCTSNDSGTGGFVCRDNSQITNCTSNDSGSDGFYCVGNSQITNCISNNSSNEGLYCSDNSQITNCTSNDSGTEGFYCSGNSQITNCTSNNSGSDGYRCSDNSQITNCTSNDSSRRGFYCEYFFVGVCANNVLKNDTLNDNSKESAIVQNNIIWESDE